MSSPATFAAVNPPPTTVINHRIIPPSSHFHNHFLKFSNPNTTKPISNLLRSIKSSPSDSTAIIDTSSPESEQNSVKIGARVRVTVPLTVYHIPKVPELDLNGKEGRIKENVAVWKGKNISANYPYKIEFFEKIDGRGDKPVKFFAHLRDDEFEYID